MEIIKEISVGEADVIAEYGVKGKSGRKKGMHKVQSFAQLRAKRNQQLYKQMNVSTKNKNLRKKQIAMIKSGRRRTPFK
jgi:hypothetical protein